MGERIDHGSPDTASTRSRTLGLSPDNNDISDSTPTERGQNESLGASSPAITDTKGSPSKSVQDVGDEDSFAWMVGHDQDAYPDKIVRKCTDVCGLLVFIIFITCAVQIAVPYWRHSHVGGYLEVHDWNGDTCNGYTYFCKNSAHLSENVSNSRLNTVLGLLSPEDELEYDKHKLNVLMPVCVNSCPTSENETVTCPHCGAACVEKKKVAGYASMRNESSIPTFPFQKLFCLPTSDTLVQELVEWMATSTKIIVLTTVRSLNSAKYVVVFAVIYSFLLVRSTFKYLRSHAENSIYVGLILVVIGCFCVGSFLYYEACNPKVYADSQDEIFFKKVAAFFLFMLGTFFLSVFCCQSLEVELATRCLETSLDCIDDIPGVMLEPFLHSIGYIAIALVTLLTCAFILCYGNATHGNDASTAIGLEDNLSLSPLEGFHFVYILLAGCWVLEIYKNMGELSISFAAQMWFMDRFYHDREDLNFSEYDADSVQSWAHFRAGVYEGLSLVMEGRRLVFRYHMGSLCFGSLITLLTRPIRTVTTPLGAMSQTDTSAVGIIITKCCWCVVCCFDNLQPFSKTAWMDMAINGGTFCMSAYFADEVLNTKQAAKHILDSASLVFELASLGTILWTTYLITLFILNLPDPICEFLHFPRFSDKESSDYISGKTVIAGMCAWTAVAVALPFMMLFDTISDNALFVYALEKMRSNQEEDDSIWGVFVGTVHDGIDLLGCIGPRKKERVDPFSVGINLDNSQDEARPAVFDTMMDAFSQAETAAEAGTTSMLNNLSPARPKKGRNASEQMVALLEKTDVNEAKKDAERIAALPPGVGEKQKAKVKMDSLKKAAIAKGK